MNPLSNFLAKYRRFIKGDSDLKEIIISVLKENSISVSDSDIVLNGGNLRLSCNPVFRNEIFIRKSKILETINSRQSRYKFSDIKF